MYHWTIIAWPLTPVSMYKRRNPQEFYEDHPQGLGAGYVISLAGEMPLRRRGGGVLLIILTVYQSMNIFTLYLNSNYVY